MIDSELVPGRTARCGDGDAELIVRSEEEGPLSWKETSGRETGPDGYQFGDVLRSAFNRNKRRDRSTSVPAPASSSVEVAQMYRGNEERHHHRHHADTSGMSSIDRLQAEQDARYDELIGDLDNTLKSFKDIKRGLYDHTEALRRQQEHIAEQARRVDDLNTRMDCWIKNNPSWMNYFYEKAQM